MALRWLCRVAVTLGVVVLIGGQPAWANVAVSLAASQLPATAAGFDVATSRDRCDPLFGGGPYRDKDVWRFGLPDAAAGDFVSLTLTFVDVGGGIHVNAIDATGSASSTAWIVTDAGWTLTAGAATITGWAESFVLAVTCPAGPDSDRLAIASQVGGGKSPLGSVRRATPPETPSGAGMSSEQLPTTGKDVGGMLTLGSTMVIAGVLLLIVRRGPGRGRHRAPRGYLANVEDVRQPSIVVRR